MNHLIGGRWRRELRRKKRNKMTFQTSPNQTPISGDYWVPTWILLSPPKTASSRTKDPPAHTSFC
eukprot:scaffold983_cov96-Skeletonema_dohrnii-CCMP3373.AAC.9